MPIRFNPDKEINFAVINKFLEHCIRGENDQHWPWSGYQNKYGYGEITIKGIHHLAHRVSYLYFNHLKKIDKLILHKPECNTSWCINPNHLYPGTQQDNINNQIQLGTFTGFQQSGENHYAAKFSDQDINDIREKRKYTSCRKLAEEYNTSHQTISDICTYQTYKNPTSIKPKEVIEPLNIQPITLNPNIIINSDRIMNSNIINIFLDHLRNIDQTQFCWLWTHSITANGYGVFAISHVTFYAHRVSYLFHNSLLQSNSLILHKQECFNKNCINPDHLYEGNHQQNTIDSVKVGTHKNPIMKGTDHPSAFLNDDLIRKIRFEKAAFNFTCKELGKKYHVSPQLISDICTYKVWKHIP